VPNWQQIGVILLMGLSSSVTRMFYKSLSMLSNNVLWLGPDANKSHVSAFIVCAWNFYCLLSCCCCCWAVI